MMPADQRQPIDVVLDQLHARGCNPKQSKPGHWTSKCPVADAHKRGDKNPSLSVSEGPESKALLYCHAGCATPDIARSLDLGLRDLFPKGRSVTHIEGGRRIKATYDYYDEHGTLVFQVVRYDPKTFKQRQPDNNGGWTWGIGGIGRRPVYHAPQVAAAIADGRPIWIVEGEKDAEALQWAVEGATTCNSGGAGQWKPEHTEALTGATEVHIIADADKPGMAHARQVAAELAGIGITAEILLPPTGHKDVAEALGAGRTLDQFRNAAHDDTELDTDEAADDDWSSIDLVAVAELIRSGDWKATVPTILEVEGSLPLFYDERVCQLFGESGGGKTWIALAALREVVRAGKRVMFIDYEDYAPGIAERLVLLGLTNEEIALVDYRNPTTGIGIGLESMAQRADEGTYALLIIDSAGEAMASGSVSPNADDEVALWFRKVKELLKVHGGPAVIVLDHIPKSTEAPSAYAIGSQRKRAAVNGAAYRVDTIKEPAKGRDGKLKLTVAKDRLGNRPKGVTAAEVDLTSGDAGALTITLHLSEAAQAAASGGRFRPTVLMERVSRWLELNPGSSQRAIIQGVEGNQKAIVTAVEVLVDEQYVSVEPGPRGSTVHTVENPYRESDEAVLTPTASTVSDRVSPRPGRGGVTASDRVPPLQGGHGRADTVEHSEEGRPRPSENDPSAPPTAKDLFG